MDALKLGEQVTALVGAIDVARERLLDYVPPWQDSKFEEMRIVLDRQLRAVQIAVILVGVDTAVAETAG